MPQGCRNQNSGRSGQMSRARLALRGRHRFAIAFSFFQHEETSLGEVSSHGHNRFEVPSSGFDIFIQPGNVSVLAALAVEHRAIGGFGKGPLQIKIHILSHPRVAHLDDTGVLPRYQLGVTRQLLARPER